MACSVSARRSKKQRICKRLAAECSKQTEATLDKRCLHDGDKFVTVEESAICYRKRMMCRKTEGTKYKFIHRGECGKDCDAVCPAKPSANKVSKNNSDGTEKGMKRMNKKMMKKRGRGGKKGAKGKKCDQDGNKLERRCSINVLKCKAIAGGVALIKDLPKMKG